MRHTCIIWLQKKTLCNSYMMYITSWRVKQAGDQWLPNYCNQIWKSTQYVKSLQPNSQGRVKKEINSTWNKIQWSANNFLLLLWKDHDLIKKSTVWHTHCRIQPNRPCQISVFHCNYFSHGNLLYSAIGNQNSQLLGALFEKDFHIACHMPSGQGQTLDIYYMQCNYAWNDI